MLRFFVAVFLLAPTQEKVVPLFNGKDLSGWTTWLGDAKREDPRGVYSVRDGMIRISGDGFGYLATEKEYRDYRLVVVAAVVLLTILAGLVIGLSSSSPPAH